MGIVVTYIIFSGFIIYNQTTQCCKERDTCIRILNFIRKMDKKFYIQEGEEFQWLLLKEIKIQNKL